MKRLLIYRHPQCGRCARIARLHHALDWFDRIDDTTATPRTGPLRLGAIAVEDLRTHDLHQGIEGVALIYRQVVVYWPLLLLLLIPPVRTWIDRDVRGGGNPRPETVGQSRETPHRVFHP